MSKKPPKPTSSPAWSGQFTEASFAKSNLGQRLLALQSDATVSNQAIADHLLRNPALVPTLGIEDMAARVAVSPATLSRFARTLGYEGYSDLRAAAADTFQTLLQPVEKLRSSIEQESFGNNTQATNVWQRSFEASLSQVSATAAGLDQQLADTVVGLLTRANEVYTLGFGLSAHLAATLALHLQPFCKRCTNVVEFGGTEVAAGRLMDIDKNDVLVILSFPRYASDALRLCNYARNRGTTIVAITDSMASPFAKLADHVLLAPAAHPVLSSSGSAALALIEALVTAIMLSNRNNVKQAAKLTEAISTFLHMPPQELGATPSTPATKRSS